MIVRNFWISKINKALEKRSLVWLSGVRRLGKTTLCHSLKPNDYLDCELPRIRHRLSDPEGFFRSLPADYLVVLDEIHRLVNPSEVLKIATDHFSHVKVVATGSSTLSAKRKFKDTLTGRKTEIHLLPFISEDWSKIPNLTLEDRMLKGGLPPFLLQSGLSDEDYVEWIDSFWSKDLQELFVIEKKGAFTKFMELLFKQSGSLFEAQPFATNCEVSRQTIFNYLEILQNTFIAHVLRPFSDGKAVEIISQPKVYGFDTGFVCYFKGWTQLREEDFGFLLEHLTFNELLAHFPLQNIFYWRTKNKIEIDFIVKPHRGLHVVAIECKTQVEKVSFSAFQSFRNLYAGGINILVVKNTVLPYTLAKNNLEIWVVNITDLIPLMQKLKMLK